MFRPASLRRRTGLAAVCALIVAGLAPVAHAGTPLNGHGRTHPRATPGAGHRPVVPKVLAGGDAYTTRTTVIPDRDAEKSDAKADVTPSGSDGLFATATPVDLGSLTNPGGGVVSMDTGQFDGTGHLGVAAITCDPCPSPYPAAYQSVPTGQYDVAVVEGKGDGTFGAPTTLSPVGPNTTLSMILAKDLGNGHTDLIVSEGATSSGPDQIFVYLGNGSGGFAAQPITLAAPGGVVRMQVASLGDGHVDLVAAETGSGLGSTDNGIVVYTGDGAGSFTASTPVPLPSGQITDLVVAPLTASGKPDIVTTVSTGNKATSLSVLMNDGSGSFPVSVTNPDDEMGSPFGVEVGDFQGTSHAPDIVVAGNSCRDSFDSSGCQVLIPGNGNGTFATPVDTDATPLENNSHRGPEDDKSFDLDQDSNPDAVWIPTYQNESTNNEMVEVVRGDGSGGFGVQDDVGTLPANVEETAVLPADLSGNGVPDLLVAGTLTFGEPTTDDPDSGLWVVSANTKEPGTYATGEGLLDEPIDASSDVWRLTDENAVVGAFSSSGNSDVIVASCGTIFLGTCTQTDINYVPGNGDGTFGALDTETYPLTGAADETGPTFGLVSGDFDGDGNLDLAYAYKDSANGAGGLEYMLGKGDGTFGAPVAVPAGNSNVESTQGTLTYTTLNGTPEIVESVLGNGGEYLESWLWNGSTFAAPVVSGPISELGFTQGDIALGHFTSGDSQDVALMSSGGAVQVFSGAADGSFNVASPTNVATACSGGEPDGAIAAGDLNGDHHDDLAWQCDGALFVALGNGAGGFSSPASYPEGHPGENDHLLLADVEGNGHLDAVADGTSCSCTEPPGVEVWHNNGDGSFADGSMYSAGNLMNDGVVTAAPLTPSGADDLLAVDGAAGSDGSVGSDIITVLHSTGGRTSLTASGVGAPTPASPSPGDFVTGSYTVTDAGLPADSSWEDSVYLASGPSGSSFTTGDPLLERIPQTHSLAKGGTYTGQYAFPLPDLAPGTYHLVVVPDSTDLLNGGNETSAGSPGFTTAPIHVLGVGTPASTTVRLGQQLYYRVTVTSASDIKVALSGMPASAGATILAAPDAVPTSTTAVVGSSDGVITLPASQPGQWFVTVSPAASLGSTVAHVTLTASDAPLALSAVSPAKDFIPLIRPPATVGSAAPSIRRERHARSGSTGVVDSGPLPAIPPVGDGQVTLTLTGAHFTPGMSAKLTAGSQVVDATQVTLRDSTVAFATFPISPYCAGLTADCQVGILKGPGTSTTPPELGIGTWDLKVTSGGHTVSLPGGFTTVGSSDYSTLPALSVTLSAPSQLRQGWVGGMTVTLANNTSQDLAIPVVNVTSSDALLGRPGETDTSSFGSTIEIDDPVLSTSPALHPSPPGILPGGQTDSFTIGILSNTSAGHAPLDTTTTLVNSTDTTSINWLTELAPYQPAGMSATEWGDVVAAFGKAFGTTEGAFASSLVTAFAAAKSDDVTLSSESDAIEFLVNEELAADPDATVSGALFLGSTAHPLGNVALTLTPSTGSSVYTATTWYDGRFAVPDVAAGTYSISAEGYLPDPVGTVTVASTKHGLTLIADAGATLTGTVTLPDGQTPVPGAVVSATVGSTTLSSAPSATDGSYTISGLPTGQAAVFAAAPGYEPANGLTAAVTQGQSATLAVQMAQAGSITGVVSSPGGSPDSSAQVDAELATGGPVITGAVSSDGSYAIADLGPGTYNVVAEDSGDGPAEQQGVAVVAGAASGGVGLQLTSTPATVHGVVTDSDSGDPVSGATVATDAANGGEGPVTTASDGSYTLDGLPAGATQISVTPPDGGYLEGTATATAIAGSTMTQNISLTPSGTLSASIDEGDGTTALADAAVEVVGPTPGTSGAPEQTQAFTTDGFGNLTVNDLPTGAYDLQVVGSDTDQAFAVGTGNRSPTVSLTVPTGVVDGTIDSSSGSPAPGVQVFIADPDGAIDTTTTDSNGHYSFLVTADESLSVVASDPSVGELSESGVAAATGTTTTAPTLRAGTASLAVTVTAGGSPADDASVTLSFGAAKDQPAALAATTNGSGVATLDNLTPGTYDLEASDGSHATSQQQVTVASGSHSLPVPLAAPGTIAGTVTDTSSSPLSGVDITADASSGLTERVKSGKSGGYSFSNLPPDTYIVTASAAAGDAPTSASGVAVTAGTTTTQNLALPTTGSTLTVSLSASVGASLSQTSLALEDSHGVTVASGEVGGAEQPSDSTAQTSFGPLSDGAYTVVATAPGRATVTQDVTVSGGTTASVTAPAGEAVPTVTSTTGPTGATRSRVRALHSAAGPATSSYWSAVQFFAKNWSTLIPNPSPDAFITYNAVKSNFANIAANWTGKCVNPYIAKAQAYLDAANAQLQRWQGDYNYLQEQTFVSELTLAGDAANAIGAVILVGVAAIPLIPAAAAIASTAGPEFGAALVALGGAQIVNQLIQGLSTFDFSQTLTQLNNSFSSVTGYLETFEAAGAVTPAFVKWGGKASALLNSILAAKSTLDDLVSAMQHLQNTVADAAASQKNFTYFLGVARSATLAIPFYQCPPNPPKNPPPPTPKPQPPYPNKSPSNYNDHDPNAIFGSLGDGSAAHYVRPATPLSYTVTFENDGDAAVTEVFVTMPLPKGVAPGSVDLTGFGFGHTSVPLTATPAFSTTLTSLGLANGDDVTAAGEYDAPTKTVRWSIEAIDPSTGDVDSSPSGGFLPTDNSADDGEGYVDVSLAPSSGLATGTAIRAHASIVFDRNAAISTPTWTNTIESSGPAATVRALPRAEHKVFTVHWSGTTHGSAIASYDIYVSNNNGNYLRWRHASKAGSATYRGKEFHRYSFIAIATDKLGNVQAFPVKAQATSIIGTPPKVVGISPARGPHGTRVIIRGSGFMKVTRVTFGARKSSYRVRSAHEIVARVPRGHGKVRITVTTVIGSATESRRFVYAASGSRRATQHRRAHLLHPRRSSRAPRAVAPDSVSLLDASRAATGW